MFRLCAVNDTASHLRAVCVWDDEARGEVGVVWLRNWVVVGLLMFAPWAASVTEVAKARHKRPQQEHVFVLDRQKAMNLLQLHPPIVVLIFFCNNLSRLLLLKM